MITDDFVKTFGIIRPQDMQSYCALRGLVITENDKHKETKQALKLEINAFLKPFFLKDATLDYYTHEVITSCWFGVTFTEEILKEMPKDFWQCFKLKEKI